MPQTERTIAHEFADAGYQTAHIGKWHLSNNDYEPQLKHKGLYGRVPRDHQGGFEHWRGFYAGGQPYSNVTYFAEDDPTPQEVDGYQTDVLADLVVDFLTEERDPDRPFFLRYGPNPPHRPHTAPPKYMDRWRERDIDFRPNVDLDPERESYQVAGSESFEPVVDELRGYYAMIENLDDNVAKILDALENQGLREETVVVFLSDHGEMLGSHGLMLKSWPFEESAGIPFIISHPAGEINEGIIRSEPTCSEDWYPTLLGLAGIDPPSPKPGENLTPLARDETTTLDRSGVLLEYVEDNREGKDWFEEVWRGFVTERYKYTVKGGSEGGTPWQLFDLEEDPYELVNVVDDPAFEAVAQSMHGHLGARMVETEDCYLLRSVFGHDGIHEDWLEIGK